MHRTSHIHRDFLVGLDAINNILQHIVRKPVSHQSHRTVLSGMVDYAHCRTAEATIVEKRLSYKQTATLRLGLWYLHRKYVKIDICHKKRVYCG